MCPHSTLRAGSTGLDIGQEQAYPSFVLIHTQVWMTIPSIMESRTGRTYGWKEASHFTMLDHPVSPYHSSRPPKGKKIIYTTQKHNRSWNLKIHETSYRNDKKHACWNCLTWGSVNIAIVYSQGRKYKQENIWASPCRQPLPPTWVWAGECAKCSQESLGSDPDYIILPSIPPPHPATSSWSTKVNSSALVSSSIKWIS